MKFGIIIIGVIVLLVFIGMYFYFLKPQITPWGLIPLTVYGKLIDYSQNGLTTFKIQSEIVNCELNNTLLEIQAKSEVKLDLIIGNNYVFYFTERFDEKGSVVETVYDVAPMIVNLTEYKEMCKYYIHGNDLLIDQMIITEGGEGTSEPGSGTTATIIPTSIIPNEETEIKIRLINKQDVSIPYRISDAKIVDELIWEPYLRQCQENEQEYKEIIIPGTPGEEAKKVLSQVCSIKSSEQRLQESVITNCQINYDTSENTISANSSKIITFKVLCKEPVSCRNWFVSDIYGNLTTKCSLILLGDLGFTDELGNIHKKDNTYFRQFLTLSEKASVNVEYSQEISSKDEFYIYVDYKDSAGNQIKDAQIELRFKNLGISGVFTLRYDETLGRYKFGWSNFVEWDPGYKKGTYSFTITAHKVGYPTIQSGPYYFTLK